MVLCVNSHLVHTIREHFTYFGVRAGNMAKGDEDLKQYKKKATDERWYHRLMAKKAKQ